MSQPTLVTPDSFTSFGDLLKYLRRRAQLSQRELSIAVGYSEPQISHLETNSRLPDAATVAARFVPALDLADEPALARRLVELARRARREADSVRGDPAVLPMERAAVALRHNLPAQATALVGRERELAEIAELLAKPECRLLTLVGVGGIGKTRLALAAAAQRVNDFPDGVWLVPLAEVSAVELLATAIMEALRVPRHGDTAPEEQILRYARDQEILLVLDNFEHLMAGTALLSRILEAGAGVKLLATSRERLRLKAEWVYPVVGLALPEEDAIERRPGFATSSEGDVGGRLTQPDALTPDDAIRLFVQSAQRADPSFRLTAANANAVWRICKHVDGMPLGIELAAGWTRLLTCDAIAERLSGDLQALRSQTRDAPVRQSSLQAVFEHSWRMLSHVERAVLAQLGVFRGGFDLAAAQAVAGADLEALGGLLDKSWLRVIEGRYDMHEVVRQFALAKLATGDEGLPADPDGKAAAQRHGAYFSDLLRRLFPDLWTGRQLQAMQAILTDIGNVQAGWRWAVQSADTGLIDGYLDALAWMTWHRGWYPEIERALTDAASTLRFVLADPAFTSEAARRETQRTLLRILCIRVREETGWGFPHEKTASNWTEFLEFWHGDGAGLLKDAEEQLARVVFAIWLADHADRPDPAEAVRLAEEAQIYFLEHEDRLGVLFATSLIGSEQIRLGHYTEAQRALTKGLAALQRAGEQFEATNLRNLLANSLLASGDLVAARRLHEETLAFRREVGGPSPVDLFFQIMFLGKCSFACGEYSRARSEFTESLEYGRKLGQRHMELMPRRALAEVLHAEGYYGAARRMLIEIAEATHELGTYPDYDVCVAMGRVECALKNHSGAARLLLEALAIGKRLQLISGQTGTLAAVAELLYATGRIEPAVVIASYLRDASEAEYLAKRTAQQVMDSLAAGMDYSGPLPDSLATLDACVALARRELTAIAS